MPLETKRFRHSRQATDADREAAKKALEHAEMSVEDAEKHLNKFSDKWSVRDCRVLMAQVGMDEEEIEAVCPQYADDRVRITLTFSRFSEDGEVTSVSDTTGVRADIPISSILQDAQDSIEVGDTVPCDILREVWESSGLVADATEAPVEDAALRDGEDGPSPDDTSDEAATPEDAPVEEAEATPDTPPATETPEAIPLTLYGHSVHRRGRDTIEVTLPLTDTERLELAQEMADALAERDSLESEFNAIKKDYKTRIDLQVNLAAQAGETYRAGERTQDVSCDVFEDRTSGHIVWLDSVSCVEVKRRLMTYEERQLKLPGMETYIEETNKKKGRKKKAEDTPPALAPDARTCLNCGHRDTNGNAVTDAMPEPCHMCSQIESGESDNWAPVHECATCTHKTTRVNMPPCAGCSLNADDTHRGKKEAWEWGQQEKPAALDADSAEGANADAMPDMPCVDDESSADDRYTPDELDDIPAECIPQDDDAMPTLPPIGDDNGAGRSGTEVRQ